MTESDCPSRGPALPSAAHLSNLTLVWAWNGLSLPKRRAGSQAADVGSHVLISVTVFTSSSVSVGDEGACGRYNQEAVSRS